MEGEAQLIWDIAKGDYNISPGTGVALDDGTATTTIKVNLGQTRIEDMATKEVMAESYTMDPDTISTNTDYPIQLLYDVGKSQKSYKVYGKLSNDEKRAGDVGSRWAFDKKNMIKSMYDSANMGSLCLSYFSAASGTNTGSEDFRIQFMNYNFIHDKAGTDVIDYQLTLIEGKPMSEA